MSMPAIHPLAAYMILPLADAEIVQDPEYLRSWHEQGATVLGAPWHQRELAKLDARRRARINELLGIENGSRLLAERCNDEPTG